MPGRIVILNGAPRSGKTTLARAIQSHISGFWINWGVDAFNASLPVALFPGIGLRPGGERPDLEPHVAALYGAFFAHMARLAHAGFDVVADLGMHADYSVPFDPMTILGDELAGLSVLLVGVDCDLNTIMARRNADPQNGRYLGGSDVPPPVARWQEAVHRGKTYDLRVNMAMLTPEDCARHIAERLGAQVIDQN